MFKTLLAKTSLLAALLLFTGCSSFFVELEQNLSGESTEIVYEDSSWSSMDSLNRYVDLVNNGHDSVSWFENDLYYLEDDISYYDPGVYEPSFYCSFDFDSYDATLRSDVLSPKELSSEESSDLVAKATTLLSNLDALKSSCEEIAKHVTAQDYKDDDFTALYAKMDAAYVLIDAFYDQQDAIGESLDAYMEIYDTWTVDPTDPVSVGQDNMDKDADSAEAIYELIEANYEAGTTEGVAAELQALYDALTLRVEANKNLETNELVAYYYEDFYKELDMNFLPVLKRQIRNFEAGDLDQVNLDYYEMIDSYNYMIDDYNWYLDATAY